MDIQQVSDDIGPLVRWLALVPDTVHLHLTCPAGPATVTAGRESAAIRLPCCVGDLPVSAWLEFALAGAQTLTIHGDCHRELPALAQARALLIRSGHPADVDDRRLPRRRGRRTHRVVTLDELSVPRRAVIIPIVGARRPGARGRLATERGRLLEALNHLGLDPADLEWAQPRSVEPNPAPVAASATSVASVASAILNADGCTACGTCVLACPEGALALIPTTGTGSGDAQQLVLTQEPTRCTDCGVCTTICPASALTRTGTRNWSDTSAAGQTTLATLSTRRCDRCRAEYAPLTAADSVNRLCPVCTDRRRSPFGSTIPAAAVAARPVNPNR